MKKNHLHPLFVLILFVLSATNLPAQLSMSDFVIYAGNATTSGCSYPSYPGPAVQLGSSSVVTGGSIGSKKLIKSTGSATLNCNLHSQGTVLLANSNAVTGKVTAANSASISG